MHVNPKNYVDVALGCFDDNFKYDDLVLSTLQTSLSYVESLDQQSFVLM